MNSSQFIFTELVFSISPTGRILEYDFRENCPFSGGDRQLYLRGHCRRVRTGNRRWFPYIPVCTAVVGQAVVVRRLAQRVAPVCRIPSLWPSIRCVRLALADQNPRSSGSLSVLQQSRARVVAGDDEHAVGAAPQAARVLACLPQRFVGS